MKPRTTRRRLASFPHLREFIEHRPEQNSVVVSLPAPILSLRELRPPAGYAHWLERYKRGRKSA